MYLHFRVWVVPKRKTSFECISFPVRPSRHTEALRWGLLLSWWLLRNINCLYQISHPSSADVHQKVPKYNFLLISFRIWIRKNVLWTTELALLSLFLVQNGWVDILRVSNGLDDYFRTHFPKKVPEYRKFYDNLCSIPKARIRFYLPNVPAYKCKLQNIFRSTPPLAPNYNRSGKLPKLLPRDLQS